MRRRREEGATTLRFRASAFFESDESCSPAASFFHSIGKNALEDLILSLFFSFKIGEISNVIGRYRGSDIEETTQERVSVDRVCFLVPAVEWECRGRPFGPSFPHSSLPLFRPH